MAHRQVLTDHKSTRLKLVLSLTLLYDYLVVSVHVEFDRYRYIGILWDKLVRV